VPGFKPGAVFRAQSVLLAPGGKGLNVARALRILGSAPLCMGFIGGHTGRLVADLAVKEGLQCEWTMIDAETRSCCLIVGESSGETSVVNEPGPQVSADDWLRLRQDILAAAAHADYVCLSGSLPPGSPPDILTDFLAEFQHSGKRVWVDTSGAALHSALKAQPDGIKINHLEVAEITQQKVETVEEAISAARAVRQMGIAQVVITLGKLGAVLVSKNGAYYAAAPRIQAISTVGSGDVFFAGLMHALTKGAAEHDALRQAVVAGAANALTVGGGHFHLEDFDGLLKETQLVES
jgi:1-phosphofructokinase family hexose kinase